jgi:protocatechuate 3,4-dioxygenase beta subunit
MLSSGQVVPLHLAPSLPTAGIALSQPAVTTNVGSSARPAASNAVQASNPATSPIVRTPSAGGVSGTVFNDLDGDGTSNGGADPGASGWEVDVIDSTGLVVASQLSGDGGQFSIQGLAPGTYSVAEVLQPGWTQTAPAPVPPGAYSDVIVTAGQTTAGLDFGNFQLVSASGLVYYDSNGDGQFDPVHERGEADWPVMLYDSAGNMLSGIFAGSDGHYQFDGVGPGTYRVAIAPLEDLRQTQPLAPGGYVFTTTSGENRSGLDFGHVYSPNPTGSIWGAVFNDVTGNGTWSGEDTSLDGWTVSLSDSSGNFLASTTSTANGYYFADLPLGWYHVSVVPHAGWVPTTPVDYAVQPVTDPDPRGHSVNFGNFQLLSVSGNVYEDINGNNTRDPGEPPLAGWIVYAEGYAPVTTDAQGNYTITGIGPGPVGFPGSDPGVIMVTQALPPGWVYPYAETDYYFQPRSGENQTHFNYGDFRTITVSGTVYDDQNGDGLRNPGEPGAQGLTVYMTHTGTRDGTVVQSQVTDASGNYKFSAVGPGAATVSLGEVPGVVQTQPVYPTIYSFLAHSGSNLSSLNFGAHSSPALDPWAVIDRGQPGYTETGIWSTVVGGFNQSNQSARTVRAAQPTATASWTFAGLSPDDHYDLYATYSSRAGNSTAAPFVVYDGNTRLASPFIDESIRVTNSQNGRAQGSYGRVGWIELGHNYQTRTGTIRVVLSNNSQDGTFVDADGVLLVRHVSAAPGSAAIRAVSSARITSGSPETAVASFDWLDGRSRMTSQSHVRRAQIVGSGQGISGERLSRRIPTRLSREAGPMEPIAGNRGPRALARPWANQSHSPRNTRS